MNAISPSVLLFCNPHLSVLERTAESFIAQKLCPTGEKLCHCRSCRLIKEHQSSSMLWLLPESSYTNEEIKPIAHRASFEQQPEAPFFFVLAHPEKLLPGAANSLLKLLEEPPANYYFILLSTNLEHVLPTIKSRSQIVSIATEPQFASSKQLHPIEDWLKNSFKNAAITPKSFDALLAKNCPDHQETKQIIEAILAIAPRNEPRLIQFCFNLLNNLPAQGGSKLFWRNCYLQAKTVSKND
jgi:DNA polymerase III delta prime subunit